MLIAEEYRIFPSKEQRIQFARIFGCCRFYWNEMLSRKIKTYKETGKTLNVTPAQIKNELKYEWLFDKRLDSLAFTNVQLNLNSAYKKFFKEKKGFPKFKSKKTHRFSYTTNNQNGTIRFLDKQHIKLPKISSLKIGTNRIYDGLIHSATIKQNPNGKYFISILWEIQDTEKLPLNNNIIGIDLGIKEFASCSDGEIIKNPKYYRKYELKLSREQRKLNHCSKGSNNYQKQRIKVANIHAKIGNLRKDFLHKVSTRLINENQVICLETLKPSNMIKNHKLAKSISDASFCTFVTMLKYKAKEKGRNLIQIDSFYPSSQLCHCCGYRNKNTKNLGIREWTCPSCNEHHDRDMNAAINIMKEGIRLLRNTAEGQELAMKGVKLVDTDFIRNLEQEIVIASRKGLATLEKSML